MQRGKSIGLFFVCAVLFLAAGFGGGILFSVFRTALNEEPKNYRLQKDIDVDMEERFSEPQREDPDMSGFLDAASLSGVLGSDTEYVLEETDVLRGTVIETRTKLPAKYIGMDRETFLAALEQYQTLIPLSERKRGFESLEVLSFSRERVVVRMNYRYVQPGESFYLALQDHQIVVFLEDKETVYIETGISADVLSQELQADLIDMIFVEDEASLYDLLEAYSS